MCQYARLEVIEPALDFALLKVDFDKNANKDWLRGKTGFPHLIASTRQLDEGEPVYAFGYPLSTAQVISSSENVVIGHASHGPRTTSAIVAATMDRTTMVSSSADSQVYVLDKALNYGNSGGPIVAVATGHVHAFCSRFQPVRVRQPHLRDPKGQPLWIEIPSLYGVVTSLRNEGILVHLRKRGVPLSND
jgi:serine protease Do